MATDRLNKLLLNNKNEEVIVELPINKLERIENSPFKIYSGEKKVRLIESVKERLISPIVVMPSENRGCYKIICGANRVDAYKQLGYEKIKSVILTDITENEAMLIMVDSNLFNRSIDDMLPSELAKALLLRQRSSKQQGKRTDLGNDDSDNGTFGTLCQKLKTEYKLSERNIRNYLRLNYLNDELLEFVDTNTIPFRSGVPLSFLKSDEQKQLSSLINEQHYCIPIKLAEHLKALSLKNNENINVKTVIDNFNNELNKSLPSIKISLIDLKQYIPSNDIKNAKEIIKKALELYYAK
jgi:ParB family chromosome partitioning protein